MLDFNRLEALMKLNGMTQSELLQKAKQSPNNFARWKSGKSTPSHSSIIAIANVLKADPDYITGISDSPYGGDIVERAYDLLLDAGAEIESFDDDNGAGQQFVITYKDHSRNYDLREFRDLCRRMVTAVNDSEMSTSIMFCQQEILGESILQETESPYYTFTKDELDFLNKYRELDPEGQIILKAALINEMRRLRK